VTLGRIAAVLRKLGSCKRNLWACNDECIDHSSRGRLIDITILRFWGSILGVKVMDVDSVVRG
jgi:hypothetical protein